MKSDWRRNRAAYKQQADEVLAIQAALTDEQKLKIELFDNKINSLGFSALFMGLSRGLSLIDFIHYDFLTNMAAYDTGIVIWQEKTAYDAVRPFSAIRFLYKGKKITAWGGPGKGTVTDMPGEEWTSYMPVADHPEYPSGSAAFCAAHAQASRHFFGSDDLGWPVTWAAGASGVERGVVPEAETTLVFPTFTALETDCGNSRIWGGVHFKSSVPPAQAMGHDIADIAYDFFRAHVDGTIGDDDDDDDGCGGGHHGHGHGRGRGHGRH